MRWWARLVATLILVPLIWIAGSAYGQHVLGVGWDDIVQQSGSALTAIFVTYTVPALVLCLLLLGVDTMLDRFGLTLLTVVTSPLIALAIAALVTALFHPAQIASTAEAIGLFTLYGAVWGLTIREWTGRAPTRRNGLGDGRADMRPGAI